MNNNNKRTISAFIAAFTGSLCLFQTQLILKQLAESFHISHESANVFNSVATLALALFSPFCAIVAEAFCIRRSLISSIFIVGLLTAFSAVFHTYFDLVLLRFIESLFISVVITVGITVYTSGCTDKHDIIHISTLYTVGMVVGSVLGRVFIALVAEKLSSWRIALFLISLMHFAAIPILIMWTPPVADHPHGHLSIRKRLMSSLHIQYKHLSNPALWSCFISALLILFIIILNLTLLELYLLGKPYSYSSNQISLIMLAYAVPVVLMCYVSRIIKYIGSNLFLMLSYAVALLSYVFLFMNHVAYLVIGFCMLNTALLCIYAVVSSSLHLFVEAHKRSTAFGVLIAMYFLGGTLGGTLASYVWNGHNWNAGNMWQIMFTLLLSVSVYALVHFQKKEALRHHVEA